MARLTDRLAALEELKDPAVVEGSADLIEIHTLFAIVLEAKTKGGRFAQEKFMRNHGFSEAAARHYAGLSFNNVRDAVEAFIPEINSSSEIIEDALEKLRARLTNDGTSDGILKSTKA